MYLSGLIQFSCLQILGPALDPLTPNALSLCLTINNLAFLFQVVICFLAFEFVFDHQQPSIFVPGTTFILFDLPYISGVGLVTYNTNYKFHTDVVDSPPCSIFLVGNIAEVGKNWYDTISTFLAFVWEGLGSSGTLVGPEIANSGRRLPEFSNSGLLQPNLQLSTSSGALQQVSVVSLAS